MMQVSQKSRYALRAVFELSKHFGEGPVRISDIASRQVIPQRFLEGILNQLKQGGLLRSIRGRQGGYELAGDPSEITVGDMMRVTEGPIAPTECVTDNDNEGCPLSGDCVFLPLWQQAADCLAEVYDSTTFQDLVDLERERRENYVPNYHI